MGLFGFGKKKQEPAPAPVEQRVVATADATDDSAPGWEAIDAEFERAYPGQTSPKHYAPIVHWVLGGNDPLDGISVYDGGDFWHFVTYGMTELYVKESDNADCSGYGYEMTFKLKKGAYDDDEGELRCICGILQMIARLAFTKGEVFAPYEFLYTGQETGIDAYQKSNITGFICVPDPTVNSLQTEFGKVDFIEFIGMTDAELKTLDTVGSVMEIYEELGSDITDYNRASIR